MREVSSKSALECGMRAEEGAIESVRIDDDVHLNVIGGGRPIGICGYGLIDAASEMLRLKILDWKGRMFRREALDGSVSQAILKRIRDGDSGKEFVLTMKPLLAKGRSEK